MNNILVQAPVYLLVFARCLALIMTLPLFSMRSTPRIAKIALGAYLSFFLFPAINLQDYLPYLQFDGIASLYYVMLLIGEVLIGIIIGFYMQIIFAAFSAAGQFMAFQMGFSAANTYDALSQVENPLVGQMFNLIAMLIFMQNHWFQKLFLTGLMSSFQSLNALSIVNGREHLVSFMISGLSALFKDALVISLPVMGTLLAISICTGLLTKAAPQMNLLSEGFPIMILVAFTLIMFMMQPMSDFFIRSFNKGFSDLIIFFTQISGGIR